MIIKKKILCSYCHIIVNIIPKCLQLFVIITSGEAFFISPIFAAPLE